MSALDDAEDIPVEEWPETLRDETRIVRKQFEDMRARGFEFGLQFVGIHADKTRIVALAADLTGDARGKDMVFEMMKQLVAGGCVEVMLAAEAWMSDTKEGYAWRMANPDKPMELYEHRIEAMYVTHYSVRGDVLAMAKIENGHLGKFRVKKTLSFSGRFSNLFLRAQEKNAERN